uniref:Uncharacterized protein n=1 Tax=Anguilla anguilla TaxID=7936 RepID=A0A0E9UZJ5_ANGAN
MFHSSPQWSSTVIQGLNFKWLSHKSVFVKVTKCSLREYTFILPGMHSYSDIMWLKNVS